MLDSLPFLHSVKNLTILLIVCRRHIWLKTFGGFVNPPAGMFTLKIIISTPPPPPPPRRVVTILNEKYHVRCACTFIFVSKYTHAALRPSPCRKQHPLPRLPRQKKYVRKQRFETVCFGFRCSWNAVRRPLSGKQIWVSLISFCFWTPVHWSSLELSVSLSVYNFSQNWFISFF